MEWLAPVLGLIVFLAIMAALARGGHRPRRGSYVMPARPHHPEAMPPTGPPPVLFHSKYCAGRYGSPCNCKGPHA